MPIHYDANEDGQIKKYHLLFSNFHFFNTAYESLGQDVTASEPIYQEISTPSASAQPQDNDPHIAQPVPQASTRTTSAPPANDPPYLEIVDS